MQGFDFTVAPVELLLGFGILTSFLIFITYWRITGKSIKQFTKPAFAATAAAMLYMFFGAALGIFIVISFYTGDLSIGPEFDILFNNPITFVFMIAFVFSFMLMLSYIYVYRGAA